MSETIVDKILKNKILSHGLFWVTMFIVQTQLLFNAGISFRFGFIANIVLMPGTLLAAYSLVYYQIPRFVYSRKYFKFILSLIISFYVSTVISRFGTVYVAEPLLDRADFSPNMPLLILTSVDRLIKGYLIPIYTAPVIMASIKLIKQRLEARQRLDQLEKEKAAAELNFLKAQIHPHFLFNTLNNLYTLTLQKSDKAPDLVVRLSEMLDYMLYQCNDDKVPLEKEIQLLKNYIDLESVRYGDRLKLDFDLNIDKSKTLIAPLLLLSLVENAFKHGASGNLDDPKIELDLQVINQQLKFRVWNTKSKVEQKDKSDFKKGIGFSNIKKQLELIYPNDYQLDIQIEEDSYCVILEIALSKKVE